MDMPMEMPMDMSMPSDVGHKPLEAGCDLALDLVFTNGTSLSWEVTEAVAVLALLQENRQLWRSR